MTSPSSTTASAPRRMYVFGAGVRARLVFDLVQWQLGNDWDLGGYFDDYQPPGASGPGNIPIIGSFAAGLQQLAGGADFAFVATGTTRSFVRCQLLASLAQMQIPIASLIPRWASISPTAAIGVSSLLMPGTFIGAHVTLGHLFCAHGGVVVEHDCRIGHNVMFGPGVTLAGGCRIGHGSFLGAGVSVAPNVRIGQGTLIGTGSVVVRDIPDHVVAFGHPAEVKRETRDGDEVASAREFQAISAQQWQSLEHLTATTMTSVEERL